MTPAETVWMNAAVAAIRENCGGTSNPDSLADKAVRIANSVTDDFCKRFPQAKESVEYP